MSLMLDSSRILFAVALLLIYSTMCLWIYVRQLKKYRHNKIKSSSTWLVVYASQTGTAEELAQQTVAVLEKSGKTAQLFNIGDLTIDHLKSNTHILFVVSTYGEGDAPDEAATFANSIMQTQASLKKLKYAVLALGDKTYTNFCGFGKTLDEWLKESNATPLFSRLDVDVCNEKVLQQWWTNINNITGIEAVLDEPRSDVSDWRLADRRLLNPDSLGEPVWHIELEPTNGSLPPWESGDLVQILLPNEDRPREYSIASIPEDKRIHLLVRLRRSENGILGAVSAWLTMRAAIGDTIPLRLRSHRVFQLGENVSRPLILIGNGTGMAGLRSHLKARSKLGAKLNWLIFGERNATSDYHYHDDIATWSEQGILDRVDAVFSRDQPQRLYVQHRLKEASDTLQAWVEQGAAIYICGSLKGMASDVHQTLLEVLGADKLHTLVASGRYRRDVY